MSEQEFNFGEEVEVHREINMDEVEEIRQVLHKYDGDFTAEEIESGLAGEPTETVVIVNGEVVEHMIIGSEGGN
jgi:hypothetical protein